jgi:DNA polymerase
MGVEVPQDWQATLASALEWWRDAGVDTLIAEEPRDWLAPVVPLAPRIPVGIAPGTATPRDPHRIIAPAMPATLAEFAIWRVGDAAPEAAWSDVRLAATGDPASDLMILIESPEREDAEAGMLLSGSVGRLFDRMLAAIGRDRSTVYLTAVAIARPVSGRLSPEIGTKLAEIARHHVGLVAPKRLLLLGNGPSRIMLGYDTPKARGSLHAVNLDGGKASQGDIHSSIQAVASFHPRFLIETPAAKAEAWKDLQMLIGGPELGEDS